MNLRGLAVVIPALNEAATIEMIIRQAALMADVVFVVDDGSSDGTGSLAAAAGAQVLRHEVPRGYDAAIAAGLNRAFELGASAVVTMDADGQHRIEDLQKVVEPVLAGEAVISCGIRNHYNRAVEGGIGFFAKYLWDTPDPFCGLKCYGRQLFEAFGPFPDQLNIGTLPLAWVKKGSLPRHFVPIRIDNRIDHPRFGSVLRASVKLALAFFRTLLYQVLSSSSSRKA